MKTEIELVGKRFGKLILCQEVLSKIYKSGRKRKFLCKCDCGNEKVFVLNNLTNGDSCSCGCIRKERNNHTIHGMTGTDLHKKWLGIINRCEDKSNKIYGGRGIKFSKRWHKFENFYEDMKDTYQKGLTIERINVNRNYCKTNCKWIKRNFQNFNKRNTHWVIYENEKMCLKTLTDKLNLNYKNVSSRLNRLSWSLNKAIITP